MMCHVLNRANRRESVFHDPAYYDAIDEATRHLPLALFGSYLRPNHFHLTLSPSDSDVTLS